MRDGVKLSAVMRRSDDSHGVVVIRTPYDASAHDPIARSWAIRGFDCVVQDVRGRYRSGGEWDPYRNEADDGATTVEHLHRLFAGKPIVAFGASYAAHAALEAAKEAAHRDAPRIAAIMTLVPAIGLYETTHPNGDAPDVLNRVGWWHQHGQGKRSAHRLNDAELAVRVADVTSRGPTRASESWGWSEALRRRWTQAWRESRIDLSARYGSIAVPLLVLSGDADAFDRDARRLATTWQGRRHFVTGPWGHGLAHDLDGNNRRQLRDAGGIGRVLENWVEQELSRAPEPASGVNGTQELVLTSERFDPTTGTWIHERTPL